MMNPHSKELVTATATATELAKDPAIQDAIEWALLHGFALKTAPDAATHCAFSFAPTLIEESRFAQLKHATPLLAKLIHNVSQDHEFLQEAMAPIASADPFFSSLLQLHRHIHTSKQQALRLPILFMRTDFMDDAELGPGVIEFNGIAAGMGPFGQRVHELHGYLQHQWSDSFRHWSPVDNLTLIDNPAIARLSKGVADSAQLVRDESGDTGQPVFMMVVQPDEDNVYDQHLLEEGLQTSGVKTVRRTFRQLHEQLSTGTNGRLLLKDVGGIDAIYLRAGYQHSDFVAHDIKEARCCEALSQTRTFMEQHRVAINATVSQQLATSKRIQMILTSMSEVELTRFGLSLQEAKEVKTFLGVMIPIDAASADWFAGQNENDWVLKNQGEGGGHCIFDKDILPKLHSLSVDDHQAWSLMRRLHPVHRKRSALLVRKGKASIVNNLISEIGLFTVHFNGEAMTDENGYAGYLIRSKPATVSEGGVHSGSGAADSLATAL